VALWRRLRRLGAVSPTGSIYILPARDECLEAFQWLAQEIRQAQGEALVMRVEQFEGLTDSQLIELFHEARREDYRELEAQIITLEQDIGAVKGEDSVPYQSTLDKLQRQYADIARIDYFECPEGTLMAARLAKVAQTLRTSALSTAAEVLSATLAEYKDRRWVTRPRPHVDRLACAWLIRRFINPAAVIRYATQPEPDEVAFDMSEAQFGHQGNLCTFETIMLAFGLTEPGLQVMAEIVHEIDLRDGLYTRPEIAGVDAILKGWLIVGLSDAELEAHGVALFEGLYATLLASSFGLSAA
jgi:hypothetical protein